ncbi:MAG: L-aspartate oxidase, partial [Myxococcota bacterium]
MPLDVDFLVIGSGLAGLNAALELAEHGQVLVLTKRGVSDSATANAQGGIASVMDETDSIAAHMQDTMQAGAGLCRAEVVQSILTAGPSAVETLIRRGVVFDRGATGFDLTREGGHSARRVLHAQDITGREIDRALRARSEATSNIRMLTHHIAVDLITVRKLSQSDTNCCMGAYVLDTTTGKVITVRAKATLLATGGAGKVYLYTSNPDVATADGVAMAYRAGADIANMEFLQFHPTCLYHPHAKSFLISEALRGEGGILRRRDGEAFMGEVHPMRDLAPRDIVARAIDREMKRSGDDYVMLDMTHKDPAFIAARFPNIHTSCLSLGIDMTKTPIPVVPAAHYLCGGVCTNLQGESTLAGLWAAGETACTFLHGANRLASNSLLEAAVMSYRASLGMRDYVKRVGQEIEVPEWDSGDAADPDEEVVVSHNWQELR